MQFEFNSNNIIQQIKTTPISLYPYEINSKFEETLKKKIKDKYEGTISTSGYILPGSISIIEIGPGVKKGNYFSGQLYYSIKYSAKYYYPYKGNNIICQVVTNNKFGVLAQAIIFPAEVVIPRQLQIDNRFSSSNDANFMNNIKIDDLIVVKIIDFDINSENIKIVGIITQNFKYIDSDNTILKNDYRTIKIANQLFDDKFTIKISNEIMKTNYNQNINSIFESIRMIHNMYQQDICKLITEINSLINSKSVDQLKYQVIGSVRKFDDDQIESLATNLTNQYDILKTNMSIVISQIDDQIKIDSDDVNNTDIDQNSLIYKFFSSIKNQLNQIIETIKPVIKSSLSENKSDNILKSFDTNSNINIVLNRIISEIDNIGINFYTNYFRNELESIKNSISLVSNVEKTILNRYSHDNKSPFWEGYKHSDGSSYYKIQGLKNIINPFEMVEEIHNEDIQKKISTGTCVNLLKVNSRAYYKFYEINSTFKLVDDFNDSNITSFHVAEGPGGFIHAIRDIRSKLPESSTVNDNYYGITRKHRIRNGILLKHKSIAYMKMKKTFKVSESNELYYFDSYDQNEKEYFLSKDESILDWNSDYSRSLSNKYQQIKMIYGIDNEIDNGDVTNTDAIFNLAEHNKFICNNCDIVTADGGFEDESNTKEVAHSKLFFHEILYALLFQKSEGHFVLKIYDIYHRLTYELIGILRIHYREVYIHKPATSRQANNEKYVICKYFTGISTDKLAIFRKLGQVWNSITSIQNPIKLNLSDTNNPTLDISKVTPSNKNYLKYLRYNSIGYINYSNSYIGYVKNIVKNKDNIISVVIDHQLLEDFLNFQKEVRLLLNVDDSYKYITITDNRLYLDSKYIKKIKPSNHQYIHILTSGENYNIEILPLFYQMLFNKYKYRFIDTYRLFEQKSINISGILNNISYNIQTRDIINNYNNKLIQNQYLTIARGIELKKKIVDFFDSVQRNQNTDPNYLFITYLNLLPTTEQNEVTAELVKIENEKSSETQTKLNNYIQIISNYLTALYNLNKISEVERSTKLLKEKLQLL